jgi:hypothetical protein
MLERVAIAAPLLRMLCVALAVCLGLRFDLFTSAIPARQAPIAIDAVDACRATLDESSPRTTIRTRTPGLHRRFLTRDIVAPRALRQYQQ